MSTSSASQLLLRAALVACLLLPWRALGAEPITLRVGHFPNVTHAQALVAAQLTRQGKGWFESRLGEGVRLQWLVYNAGPSAMEAITRVTSFRTQVLEGSRRMSSRMLARTLSRTNHSTVVLERNFSVNSVASFFNVAFPIVWSTSGFSASAS